MVKQARSATLRQASWRPVTSQFTSTVSAFSTSRPVKETAGEVDAELISKFESELSLEKETRDEEEVPTSVKDYLENGPFEIEDIPGQEEVVLTRKFGDEKYFITFSGSHAISNILTQYSYFILHRRSQLSRPRI